MEKGKSQDIVKQKKDPVKLLNTFLRENSLTIELRPLKVTHLEEGKGVLIQPGEVVVKEVHG